MDRLQVYAEGASVNGTTEIRNFRIERIICQESCESGYYIAAGASQCSQAQAGFYTVKRTSSLVNATFYGWTPEQAQGTGGLQKGEGDCDSDTDCAEGLKCLHDQTSIPGVISNGVVVSQRDFCYDPIDGTAVSSAATAQEACLSGYYSAAGAWQCEQAEAGYYTTDGSGTAVSSAATAQEACLSGYYSAAGAWQCDTS